MKLENIGIVSISNPIPCLLSGHHTRKPFDNFKIGIFGKLNPIRNNVAYSKKPITNRVKI